MANLDNRLVRMGLEINGQIKYFDKLNIYASGTKYASGLQNEVDVKITNLNKADRDYIMTAISPYNLDRTPKKVIIDAGRQSRGYQRVFVGDLIRGEISQPPDITISMKARTSTFAAGNIVAINHGASISLSSLAQKVANDLGLALQFHADDKLISNYTYNGGALGQVEKLGQVGAVNAYVDDLTLVVKKYGIPIPGNLVYLSEQTGLVGMPQLDIQGVTAKFMLDAVPVLGGGIEIFTKIYPAANGVYSIYKLDFEIANRDVPFYWTARASRPGMGL